MYTGTDRYGDLSFDDLPELDQDEELLDQAPDEFNEINFDLEDDEFPVLDEDFEDENWNLEEEFELDEDV